MMVGDDIKIDVSGENYIIQLNNRNTTLNINTKNKIISIDNFILNYDNSIIEAVIDDLEKIKQCKINLISNLNKSKI